MSYSTCIVIVLDKGASGDNAMCCKVGDPAIAYHSEFKFNPILGATWK